VTSAPWTTADYALIVSICSAAVSLFSLAWNVWSKFIYPKPRVRVSFAVVNILQSDGFSDPFLSLTTVNHGPSETTLHNIIGRKSVRLRQWQYAIFKPLDTLPPLPPVTSGPFSGGLPKKLAVGESFSAYLALLGSSRRCQKGSRKLTKGRG
jgi:hypothetical protein